MDGPRRSTRERRPVQRLIYDGYVACHYAYIVKVVQDVEPICFEDAIGHALGIKPWMKRWLHWMQT
jgi:hypothetical protein